jgi:hypothetical protein|tara:strand:+ start:1550 stop:1723 length:174 start_codon:yes stop_codon:yes gene_type:complete
MALSSLTRKSANAARSLQTGQNNMGGMTIEDLLDAQGKRKIAYVQVVREEEAIAAAQ